MLPTNMRELFQRKIEEHQRQIEFLERPGVEMWEKTDAGKLSVKQRMIDFNKRAIEEYQKLLDQA